MSTHEPEKKTLKQKVRHEALELFWIFLYLAIFLCVLTTYSMLLLKEYDVKFLRYGAALLNALITAKVVLLGEAFHLGRRLEHKPLFISALYKSFLFSLLVGAMHVLEETIKGLLHDKSLATSFHEVDFNIVVMRNLVVFFLFISFFCFRELRRIYGDEKFVDLFFRVGASSLPPSPEAR